MFSSLLILLTLIKADLGLTKGLQFRPLSKIFFYIFVVNLGMLLQLGAKHVESPFIELGQISTIFYFSYFLIIMPAISIIENTFMDLITKANR
jgi:ubiquinol-cytochrome c reductase cytochrome b subunit